MRGYVITTGALFAAVTLVHVLRMFMEGRQARDRPGAPADHRHSRGNCGLGLALAARVQARRALRHALRGART
jgi:hypothetical protein